MYISNTPPSSRYLSAAHAAASDPRLERFHRIAHEIISTTLRPSDTQSVEEIEEQFNLALKKIQERRRVDIQ